MRYEISYNNFNRVFMRLLFVGPNHSFVDLTDDTLTVRLGAAGWGFHAAIPRSAIVAARPYDGFVGGCGGHGWNGSWLVNGSSKGIVQLDIDPTQHGAVLGVRVKLCRLRISLVDRPGFLAALALPPSAPAGGAAVDRTAAG